MKVVTLRNLPPELARRIRQRADEAGTSLARTVIALLEERLGLRSRRGREVLHDDLDELAGSWTSQEADGFDAVLADQRAIDADLWQ